MNRYQKIALILGALSLIIAYGKTIAKIGLGSIAFMGKGIVILVVTLIIFFSLKGLGKKE